MADYDTIVDNVDIVDEVGKHTALEKRGKNYFMVCPYHEDTSPSLSLSRERKMFRCFVCGESGNVIKLVSTLKQASYTDTAKQLNETYNLGMKFQVSRFYENHRLLFETYQLTQKFYSFVLHKTTIGDDALKYLANRGITPEVIKYFNIGVSPGNNELSNLFEHNKIDTITSLSTKLVSKSKSNKLFDIFRNRIMIPIYNELGHCIAFGGRIYNTDDPAKYINSSETDIFKKSDVLFNLQNAKEFIKKSERVILVEGYMDVISVYQADVKNSIASMGTALTNNQIDKIKSLTDNITLCFDGDKAGIEATISTIERLAPKKMNVKVAVLKGIDPDEYIKKHSKESFITLLDNAIDDVDYFYHYHKKQLDNSPSSVVKLKNTLSKILYYKDNYYQEKVNSLLKKDFSTELSFNNSTQSESIMPVANDNFTPVSNIDAIPIIDMDYSDTSTNASFDSPPPMDDGSYISDINSYDIPQELPTDYDYMPPVGDFEISDNAVAERLTDMSNNVYEYTKTDHKFVPIDVKPDNFKEHLQVLIKAMLESKERSIEIFRLINSTYIGDEHIKDLIESIFTYHVENNYEELKHEELNRIINDQINIQVLRKIYEDENIVVSDSNYKRSRWLVELYKGLSKYKQSESKRINNTVPDKLIELTINRDKALNELRKLCRNKHK